MKLLIFNMYIKHFDVHVEDPWKKSISDFPDGDRSMIPSDWILNTKS